MKNQRSEQAERRTILIADDEGSIRNLLKDALEGEGYSVRTASSAAQACEIYRLSWKRIDHVILDMRMEHSKAGEVAFRKMLTINPQVRASLLSGYADPEAVDRMRGRGLCRVWQKPIKIAEILKSLGEQQEQRNAFKADQLEAAARRHFFDRHPQSFDGIRCSDYLNIQARRKQNMAYDVRDRSAMKRGTQLRLIPVDGTAPSLKTDSGTSGNGGAQTPCSVCSGIVSVEILEEYSSNDCLTVECLAGTSEHPQNPVQNAAVAVISVKAEALRRLDLHLRSSGLIREERTDGWIYHKASGRRAVALLHPPADLDKAEAVLQEFPVDRIALLVWNPFRSFCSKFLAEQLVDFLAQQYPLVLFIERLCAALSDFTRDSSQPAA